MIFFLLSVDGIMIAGGPEATTALPRQIIGDFAIISVGNMLMNSLHVYLPMVLEVHVHVDGVLSCIWH